MTWQSSSNRIVVTATSPMAPSDWWIGELVPVVLEAPKDLDEETAPDYVKKRLHKLCGHGGWPREAILFDEDEGAPPPEEVKRSKGRRRPDVASIRLRASSVRPSQEVKAP